MAIKAPNSITDGHFIFAYRGTPITPYTPVASNLGQEKASQPKGVAKCSQAELEDESVHANADWWEGQVPPWEEEDKKAKAYEEEGEDEEDHPLAFDPAFKDRKLLM